MIDLTKTINNDLDTYPGDPKVSLSQIKFLKHDGYNDYLLQINMHTGTHIDGINHMKEGKKISDISLEHFIGVGKVIEERFMYQNEEVLIIPTKDVLSESLVKAILRYPIKYIVIEGNSIDESPYKFHHMLFEKGIMIVENAANLSLLEKDVEYLVYAIPLKIESDSSPIRLFAQKIK